MMRAINSPCLTSLAAALCLTGCSSIASRSNEKAAVYDSLSSGTQQRLDRGKINIGDTQEMVYVAMGKPDEKRDSPNADGYQSVWIYINKHPSVKRRERTGWSEVIVPAVRDQHEVVIHEEVTKDVYRTQAKDEIHVVFARGVVSGIE